MYHLTSRLDTYKTDFNRWMLTSHLVPLHIQERHGINMKIFWIVYGNIGGSKIIYLSNDTVAENPALQKEIMITLATPSTYVNIDRIIHLYNVVVQFITEEEMINLTVRYRKYKIYIDPTILLNRITDYNYKTYIVLTDAKHEKTRKYTYGYTNSMSAYEREYYEQYGLRPKIIYHKKVIMYRTIDALIRDKLNQYESKFEYGINSRWIMIDPNIMIDEISSVIRATDAIYVYVTARFEFNLFRNLCEMKRSGKLTYYEALDDDMRHSIRSRKEVKRVRKEDERVRKEDEQLTFEAEPKIKEEIKTEDIEEADNIKIPTASRDVIKKPSRKSCRDGKPGMMEIDHVEPPNQLLVIENAVVTDHSSKKSALPTPKATTITTVTKPTSSTTISTKVITPSVPIATKSINTKITSPFVPILTSSSVPILTSSSVPILTSSPLTMHTGSVSTTTTSSIISINSQSSSTVSKLSDLNAKLLAALAALTDMQTMPPTTVEHIDFNENLDFVRRRFGNN